MLKRLRSKGQQEKKKPSLVTLTPEAAEALRTQILASPTVPETAGLRLFVRTLDRPRNQKMTASLGCEIAEKPEAGDKTLEQDGVLIYLERGAVHFLATRRVEVAVDGTRLQLLLVN